MDTAGLIGFFERHRARNDGLVLATVIATEGSTYSKAGAHMLIDAEGRFKGMLSGGCLEGDLAVRARAVLETGKALAVTYDLARDDEELWGLGVGCDGLMRVLLQPLDVDYEPFAAIARILEGDDEAALTVRFDPPVDVDGAALDRLDIRVTPPPNVLLAGGGLDAEPLVRMAAELGWRCTVVDHRPAYIDGNDFSAARASLCMPADALSKELDLESFDMAVVMSHHLTSDRSYLRQLARSGIGYIGLLGPDGRKRRLLSELGDDAGGLGSRVHGPAGLDIGGRGPASIALSIVAQMHAYFFGRG